MKFGNPLGFSVDITNATLPVSGNVNANITNAALNVSGSTVNLSAGTAVQATVTNNVTVTPSGTVNVQGVVGGTTIGIAGAVTVTSGSVAVSSVGGTVAISGNVTATISGTPNVTISGTPTVNLSAGTSVQVSNNVTVTPSGTVNVQGVAGGTSVGIAGTVAVSSVSGSVNIGTVSGTVTVAGTVTATISGTPSVTISGTPTVTITSGSVNVGTVGTLTAIIDNVNTQAAIDSLTSGSTALTAGTQTALPSISGVASVNSYSTLILQFSGVTSGACVTAWASRIDSGGTITNFPAISCFPANSLGGDAMFLPVANVPGDKVYVTVVTSVGFTLTWKLYGTSEQIPNPFPNRSDGRPYPLGTRTANANTAGVNGTVIAAPTSPMKVLLKTCSMFLSSTASGAGFVLCTCTVNGSTYQVGFCTAWGATQYASANIPLPPDGILCDAGTAVTMQVGGVNISEVYVTYDLVT